MLAGRSGLEQQWPEASVDLCRCPRRYERRPESRWLPQALVGTSSAAPTPPRIANTMSRAASRERAYRDSISNVVRDSSSGSQAPGFAIATLNYVDTVIDVGSRQNDAVHHGPAWVRNLVEVGFTSQCSGTSPSHSTPEGLRRTLGSRPRVTARWMMACFCSSSSLISFCLARMYRRIRRSAWSRKRTMAACSGRGGRARSGLPRTCSRSQSSPMARFGRRQGRRGAQARTLASVVRVEEAIDLTSRDRARSTAATDDAVVSRHDHAEPCQVVHSWLAVRTLASWPNHLVWLSVVRLKL